MSEDGPSEDAKQTVHEEARHVIGEQLQTLRESTRRSEGEIPAQDRSWVQRPPLAHRQTSPVREFWERVWRV